LPRLLSVALLAALLVIGCAKHRQAASAPSASAPAASAPATNPTAAGPAPAGAPKISDLPLFAEARAMYIGRYSLPEAGKEIVIFEDSKRLKALIAGDPPLTLLYQGYHTFIPSEEPTTKLVFDHVGSGKAEGVTLTRSTSQHAQRAPAP
jgi:hypothetical protein